MSSEAGPGPDPQREFASLQGCFVEGSAEQRVHERRIRRRALIISVAAQSVIVTLIILIPLFGKPERIALANTPIPPYYHSSTPSQPNTPATPGQNRRRELCATCYSPNFPAHPATTPEPASDPAPAGFEPSGPASGPQPPWGIGIADDRRQPEPPRDARPQKPQRIFKGHIEPAMLIHRVEPAYPALARQVRVEGHVELHAIIATDGTIQSLQVISGHPLLVQSALEAVRQWRYRATILDGQPVEVDTYITVIYSLAR